MYKGDEKNMIVEMNKDIRLNKNKLFGPFSGREIAHLGMATISSALVKMFFFPEVSLLSEEMSYIAIFVSLPFIASGWLKVYNMYLDEFIKKCGPTILAPRKRVYDNGLTIKREKIKTKPSKDKDLQKMI